MATSLLQAIPVLTKYLYKQYIHIRDHMRNLKNLTERTYLHFRKLRYYNQTATILLGSTLTLMNITSSFIKCRFFSISCETNFGNPNPKESGSLLGLWKFFHVGSGMKLSTMLQAFSGQLDWSNKVNDTECAKGQRKRASYSPGNIFMYTDMWLSSPAPLPFGNSEAC